MLVDPLSVDPLVVSGSANFSQPSQRINDENMIVIRGDTRVARHLFRRVHAYFRPSLHALYRRKLANSDRQDPDAGYLKANPEDWLRGQFDERSYKAKRRRYFVGPLRIATILHFPQRPRSGIGWVDSISDKADASWATHRFTPTAYHNVIGSLPSALHIADGDAVITETIDAAGYDKEGVQQASRPKSDERPDFCRRRGTRRFVEKSKSSAWSRRATQAAQGASLPAMSLTRKDDADAAAERQR